MTTGTELKAQSERRSPRIRNPCDFWGSLTLAALALFALYEARDLPGRQGHIFGPGTTPRLLAILLLVLAIGVAVSAFFADGERIGRFRLRGPLFVTVAILVFAVAIRPLGLAVTTFVCFLIVAAASDETRWGEAVITAAGFTVGAVLLFRYGLSLPFAVWPTF